MCYLLDVNRDKYNLTDKNVIELGAGTGLVSIVTSLLGETEQNPTLHRVLEQNCVLWQLLFKPSLHFSSFHISQPNLPLSPTHQGAKVTSTDLPNILGNLQYNVSRNTRGRCRHTPEVTELIWGQELEQRFPQASSHFDYILAADVVYAHPYLEELMQTFEHLCQEGTQILWAMRFRLDKENTFVERFQSRFQVEEVYNLPSLCIKLYRAWKRVDPRGPA